MNTGLLWFDNDPKRDLTAKVAAAATRYTAKFGHPPTVCYVNPADLNGERQVGDVELKPRRATQRHHLWIGVE